MSQKAHSALRWLIARQGYQNEDQRIVAWAVSGNPIPKVIAASDEMMVDNPEEISENSETPQAQFPIPPKYKGDAGQLHAMELNNLIRGYRAKLQDREDVVVIAVDSATTDTRRLAITYYRELQASEFLTRIQSWHEHTAWPQDMGIDPKSGRHRRFIGAPSPYDIAEAAYGRKVNGGISVDDKLCKATIERLLPCIIDARPIPRDLVRICVQRACNRLTMNGPDFWEKCLGIACALFRGGNKEEQYTMSLDETRTTRDYLYGRLLAIADNIEWLALRVADENRDTNAAQLMQRFADYPFTTWQILECKLRPYMTRLRTSRAGALYIREQLLDKVMGLFRVDVHGVSEFVDNSKLSGEVLLGYHNQREALIPKKPKKDAVVNELEGDSTEEEEL